MRAVPSGAGRNCAMRVPRTRPTLSSLVSWVARPAGEANSCERGIDPGGVYDAKVRPGHARRAAASRGLKVLA